MNSSTNVPYWVVASRVGCVLSQIIAASGDLPLKMSFTPEHSFTNSYCHEHSLHISVVLLIFHTFYIASGAVVISFDTT